MITRAFIATSLDGYIARPDGGLSFLEGFDPIEGEDFGYARFMAGVDGLLMGRRTYAVVAKFETWPYLGKRVFILTHRDLQYSHVDGCVSGTPPEILARLGGVGISSLYVDGGETIQQFIRYGLLDELTITIVPVLIGSGVRLFGEVSEDMQWRLVAVRSWQNGYAQSTYVPKESGPR